MDNLDQLIEQAKTDFLGCFKLSELDHIKARFLGKSGPIAEAMKTLSLISA
jgi:phenylalanyl-tRNA synthetase alpha chain